MAFGKVIGSGAVKAGTITQSYGGNQYVSKAFRMLLAAHGCRHSMSRRGYQTTKQHTLSFLEEFGYDWKKGRLYALSG